MPEQFSGQGSLLKLAISKAPKDSETSLSGSSPTNWEGTAADGNFPRETVNSARDCAPGPVIVTGERRHGQAAPVAVRGFLKETGQV
jgi:hypothetical protein